MSSGLNDDFWIDPIKYPNDFEGNPAYEPMNPGHPRWQRFTNWHDMGPNGEYLRSEQTKWVWIHPSNWKVWHLAGPMRGREGVALAKELEGVMDPDFDIKYSEGPYLIGAEPERVDYKKRVVNLGVWVQANGNAERPSMGGPFAYRLIEDAWWNSWSRTVPGYLGCFTRTHGWRWLALIKGETTKTVLSTDPTANGNNAMMWNITAHAPYPFYAKRSLTYVWKAKQSTVDAHGVATGIIPIANRGTWKSKPKFLVKGAGTVTIQDGIGGRQITLPKLFPTDGAYMMVDTDETKQTIVTEKEPIDNELYKFLRNSQLADILLHDVTSSSLPAQRRIPGGIGFDGAIPPRTVAHLKVTHTNPQGSVTCIMPQHYEMAWA